MFIFPIGNEAYDMYLTHMGEYSMMLSNFSSTDWNKANNVHKIKLISLLL